MENMEVDNERKNHFRMVFDDNEGGWYYDKPFLHAKIWDVPMSEKWSLIKGGYSVEVSGYEGKKLVWEVIEDCGTK